MLEYGLEWHSLDSYFQFKEITAPGTPQDDHLRLYAKDNGSGVSALYYKDDAGTEVGPLAGGSGVATRVAFWSSTTALSSDASFYWDNTNKWLGIGSSTPLAAIDIYGTSAALATVSIQRTTGQGSFWGYRVTGSANTVDQALAMFGGGGSHTGLTADRAVQALLGFYAAETWTVSAKGEYATLEITPTGSTSRNTVARFDANTGGGRITVGGGTAVLTSNTSLEFQPKAGQAPSVLIRGNAYGSGIFMNYQGTHARGVSGTPTATQADDVIARFSGLMYGASQYSAGRVVAMDFFAAENATNTANGTYITFGTTPTGSVTIAERLRIGPAGQIGIGGATYGTSGNLLRSNGSAAAVSWQDHTADFLSQYALLAGRSGGQILKGGTASGDDLTFNSTAHATKGTIFFGASAAYDEVNGRIGIGTTTPEQMVHVQKDTESALDVGILADSYNDNDAMVNFFAMRRRLGTIGAQTAVTSNKLLGNIYFQGSSGTNESTHIGNGASIAGFASENWSTTSTPGYIKFNTTPSGSLTLTEAMRITAAGFVGIGATSPVSPLEVNKTVTNNSASHAMATIGGTLNGNSGGASGEMFSMHMSSYFQPSASISLASGFRTDITADPGTGVTINSYLGGRYVIYTGSSAGAITNLYGMEMVPVYGSIKPTSAYGLNIANFGSASITTAVGIAIAKPTNATNNFYMSFDTADATDPTGTVQGRIPVLIAGVLRYLAYY